MNRHPLYQAALDADAAFHAAVVAQFGAKAAGDMRYMRRLHNPATAAARDAKLAADEAWINHMRANRGAV